MIMKEDLYVPIKECARCGSKSLTTVDAHKMGYQQPKHQGKKLTYCEDCGEDLRLF